MPLGTLIRLMALQLAGALVMGGLVLFLPAGTLAWPQAWVYLALFYCFSQGLGLWLLQRDPDLLLARMKSPLSGDQRPLDRAILAAILVCFLAWFVFMALDARRFAWTHTALWLQVAGGGLIGLAFWGWGEVLRENSFAATTIEVQAERGQKVIDTGPYSVVRHPMYAATIPFFVGTSLLLGSVWGLAWLVVFLPLLGARAIGEEAVLRKGLEGYDDYARKVRHRLAPGVW